MYGERHEQSNQQATCDPNCGFPHRDQPVCFAFMHDLANRRDSASCTTLNGIPHQRSTKYRQQEHKARDRNRHFVALDAIEAATSLAILNCACRVVML